ncbi:MAG: hypothetical protein JNM78_12510 [Cyclobacteriaceae bacterium]|nr:hypothetical protein [Cyclobacteriaceae bacterium]
MTYPTTKSTWLFFLFISGVISTIAQTNESPAGAYTWKKNKTELQDGYVVLKSGKRMEGKISLKGSPTSVSEIEFKGEGKEVDFPIASLKAYGLVGVNPNASVSASAGAVNESPSSMYEWRDMGVVMNKKIESTTPRLGYMVLKDGTRYEGELKLRRKDGILEDFEVKTDQGKQKADANKVARYGYTISEAEVAQLNLAKEIKKSFPGSINTGSGTLPGEITIKPSASRFSSEKIIFEGRDGKLSEYDPKSITGFSLTSKGKEVRFTALENVFVKEIFKGKTFQVYMNPKPTSINKFATSLAKNAAQIGTAAAASAVVNADAKKNNYTTNLDSIIRVSSTEDLITLRDAWANAAGYDNADDALEQSDNESLKANIGALELAIAGREVANSEGGILNEEWVIFNRITNEKTVVYKSEFKDQIEALLFGCDKYLELSKSQQNEMQKWNNFEDTMKFLDGCY